MWVAPRCLLKNNFKFEGLNQELNVLFDDLPTENSLLPMNINGSYSIRRGDKSSLRALTALEGQTLLPLLQLHNLCLTIELGNAAIFQLNTVGKSITIKKISFGFM